MLANLASGWDAPPPSLPLVIWPFHSQRERECRFTLPIQPGHLASRMQTQHLSLNSTGGSNSYVRRQQVLALYKCIAVINIKQKLGRAASWLKKWWAFSWNTKYQNAIEAAKGFCYLHHDCSPLIVHRDVKSNNIPWIPTLKPMLQILGLPIFDKIQVPLNVCLPLQDPMATLLQNMHTLKRVDEKSDVYIFGVVLLELITGRRLVREFGDRVDIVKWGRKMTNSVKEGVLNVLDSRLYTLPLQEIMHVFYVAHDMCRRTECRKANHEEDLKN
eukprot:Gb_07271 [translate_table: standard]